MKKLASISGVLFFLPFLALAQTSGSGYVSYLTNLIAQVGNILNILIPILVTAAVVVFFVDLVQYIAGGEKTKTNGTTVMKAGLISIFIMVSLWGIIALFQNVANVRPNGDASVQQTPPSVPHY